jgi:glycosyltransferase involved in cell wall biosynthesis
MTLRILFTATSYPDNASDWKGVFIRRIAEALARQETLQLRAWCPPGPLSGRVERATTPGDDAFLGTLMDAGGIAHLLRRHRMRGVRDAMGLLWRQRRAFRRSDADLFHINWLQNALALPSGRKPALVTVLGSDMQLLRLPGVALGLRRAFRHRRVAICPNAGWMVPELQARFGDVALVRGVAFGIDPRWYAVERMPAVEGRAKWLCVSRLTPDKLGPLFEWTAPAFAHGDAELHLFGPMQEQVELPAWVHWHGPASPDELREDWFPRAQGLITLSRHAEGRPQVMLEALASGLPIVASRLPAHDDLLGTGDGGILCASPQQTLAAIELLADESTNRALGQRGRMRMRQDIGTWDDCAGRYVTLYHQLLEQAMG